MLSGQGRVITLPVSILLASVFTGAFFIPLFLLRLRRKWRNELQVTPKGRGYLYAFNGRFELPFFTKIGRAKDLNQRMSQHKTAASPFGVYVIMTIRVKNDRYAEKLVHNRFKREHIKTSTNADEWFWYSPRIWLYLLLVQDYELTRVTRKKF